MKELCKKMSFATLVLWLYSSIAIAQDRIAAATPANDTRPAVAPQQPAAAANDNTLDLFSETQNDERYSFPHK